MSLETEVMSLMKDAMKNKDEAMLRGLRAIKAEIIKAKTDPGANGEISADTELKLLPAQMSEEDVKAAVQAIISEVGASGPQDLGKVMGVATKQLAGQADGKVISAIAKSLLTA